MTHTLQRTAGGPTAADWWKPVSIGPKFDWIGRDRIRVADGPLAGREFRLTTEVLPDRAACYLQSADKRVGQCLVERDPPGEGIVLADSAVRPELRRGGLCAVMTWALLRELVTTQTAFSFRVRMTDPARPGSDPGLRNVGICVVAARLGLTSDNRLDRLLVPGNIAEVRALPAEDGTPPGMRATIRSRPRTVVGVLLDPDTFRPVDTPQPYREAERNPRLAAKWARQGRLAMCNGDWSLRPGGLERFLRAVALDAEEAVALRRRARRLA
jgi:hypothetical protein